MTDDKNEELKIKLNGNAKVKTPFFEKPDDYAPGGRAAESDTEIISDRENPGLEKCSIRDPPGLNSVLEYASRIRAFIGLEDDPDVASDSPVSDGNFESDEQQILSPELDKNVVDENEHMPVVSNLSLCQPDLIENADKNNIDIPIDDNKNECLPVVDDDVVSVSKQLYDDPGALSIIDKDLNDVTTNDHVQCLYDGGISINKELVDQPATLSIVDKNLATSDNIKCADILLDNKKNNRFEAEKNDSNIMLTDNNLLKDQIVNKDDVTCDNSIKKNDSKKLHNNSKNPLFDSNKNINDSEICKTHDHDDCGTVENYLNCSEESDDVVNRSNLNDANIISVLNRCSKESDEAVDMMEPAGDSRDSINLIDSKTSFKVELLDNDNLLKSSNCALDFPKEDQDSCILKENMVEEISLTNPETYYASVNEEEPSSNLNDGSKDLIDNEKLIDEINHNVEHAPSIEQLRRLSSEIVNRVLDSAENKLRNIVEEAQKANTDVNTFSFDNTIAEKNLLTSKIDENNSINLHTDTLKLTENNTSREFDNSNSDKNKVILTKEVNLKDVLAKTYDSKDFMKKVESEMNTFDPEHDVDPDIICGIGSFRPQWLQPWATAKVYLVLYSIIGILSGSYYSYLIGSISTLEKRFAFKSKLSGSVMVVDEITPLLLGVLVGYFGGRAHRPRMVAFGMMLSSLACFVSALPYFIYGAATHLNSVSIQNTTEFDRCEIDEKIEECDADDRPPTMAAVLFLMLGSFLKGFGNLAYYAVGLAYMDDNAKKKNTPMYFAFAYALRLLGPLVGFLMSYSFLKYHENPFADPGFGPEDPRWIGGWWMGFMLQGVLLIICSAPIALFPRRLPGHKLAGTTVRKGEGLVSNLAGLCAALKRLGKNPLFIFLVINTIFSVYGSFGHYIMLPKYMENQFRVSASQASLLSGPPGIAALIVSTLIGGYLIYRFKPNAKFLTGCLAILELLGAVGFLILMIPKCESIQMSNYGMDDQGLILEGPCNTYCSCSTKAFTPVCAPDGKTHFFSPCYAGCHGKANESFTECSCIADSYGPDEESTTEGFCVTHGCWNQALIYVITLPIISFIVNLLRVADTMVFLRCIKTEDKSVALGTFETFLSAFGFIPYPVVFGALVDSACLVWEKSCGQTGNCWFYDVTKFSYLLHGASALFSGLSALCMFVVFCLSDRVNDLYKEDEDTEQASKRQSIKAGQEETESSSTRL